MSQEINLGFSAMTLNWSYSLWSTGIKPHHPPKTSQFLHLTKKKVTDYMLGLWYHYSYQFFQGHTINSAKYEQTLETLRARLRGLRPGKTAIIQHDNARPPHKSWSTDIFGSFGTEYFALSLIQPIPCYVQFSFFGQIWKNIWKVTIMKIAMQ